MFQCLNAVGGCWFESSPGHTMDWMLYLFFVLAVILAFGLGFLAALRFCRNTLAEALHEVGALTDEDMEKYR